MNKIELKNLGFTDKFAADAALYNGLYAGRVLAQYKDFYKVIAANGEITAEISGKFRFAANALTDFPTVGDFVMLDRNTNAGGNAIIQYVLPRKSTIIRKAAGTSREDQIVASNIDTIFLCMSLNSDFNLRRLERYLALAWNSGALPVVVLTKSDLCDDIESRLQEVTAIAIGADIVVASAVRDNELTQISRYLKPGQTASFIGSSGVGKSTLINRLIGESILDTNGLRNDDKGRHTTTRRELYLLKNGGMVIDTPGMRELGLESANLAKTFADIDALAAQCKFRDCSHTTEPGCAILASISGGTLAAERLLSYQKLKKEVKYEGLDSKQIETVKLNEMFKEVGGMKNARKNLKK